MTGNPQNPLLKYWSTKEKIAKNAFNILLMQENFYLPENHHTINKDSTSDDKYVYLYILHHYICTNTQKKQLTCVYLSEN